MIIVAWAWAFIIYLFGLWFVWGAQLYPRQDDPEDTLTGIKDHPLHLIEGILWPIALPLFGLIKLVHFFRFRSNPR